MSTINNTNNTNQDTNKNKKTIDAKLDELRSELSNKELEHMFKRIFFSVP